MSQVNWERILIPQSDMYDSIELRKLARERFGQPTEGDSDKIAYKKLPPDIGGNFDSVPNHEHISEIEGKMQLWVEGWSGFQHFVDEVYPLEARPYQRPASPGSVSGHNIQSSGILGLFVTFGSIPGAVAGCWHEFGHLRLHSLGIRIEEYSDTFFSNPPTARYVSAIRKDKLRPISACLHGLYAWSLLSEGHLRFNIEEVRGFLSLNVLKLEDGLKTQKSQSILTPAGKDLLLPYYDYVEDLIQRIWNALGRRYESRDRQSYEQWKDSSPVPNDPLYAEGE